MNTHGVRSICWAGIVTAVAGCNSTPQTYQQEIAHIKETIKKVYSKAPRIPCWLQNPVSQERTGFIGVTPVLDLYGQKAIKASRKVALHKLAQYYSFMLTERDLYNISTEGTAEITLDSGRTVTFLPAHVTDSVIYSYVFDGSLNAIARLSQSPMAQCTELQCDFSQCTPSWLCDTTPNTITSVSYLTVAPHQQLAQAQKNAGVIASLLDTSHVNIVDTQTELYQNLSGTEHHSISRTRSGNVTAREWQSPLLHTRSCSYGHTLVAQFMSSKNITRHDIPLQLHEDWKTQPQFQGRAIALGNFGEKGKMTADTLLSTAIDLAIKDALIELAKVKGVEVLSGADIRYDDGHYYLSNSQFSVNQIVSGELIDIKVTYKNDIPMVYVWLLEVV
ncbi:hypothetical protein PCIT_a4477 [Pseudoalteromonas citrea]|uniref:Uncharacterized protein n=2 Tax=Pseudoalteromonas citrea TaxID=43655 RepID=A0AAD4FQL0_9GAMM|nr:hypothetical protein [Pseudoalteromonas citrea]KAF7765153.1 hypothetical protein PCIT_a4477 [Pseudoalteromonas citrea]